MKTIGTFTKTENGFVGSIETLKINIKDVAIVKAEKTKPKSPDYVAKVGSYELGAGWLHQKEDGKKYISLKLDDHSFEGTLLATLWENTDGTFSMTWGR